MAGVKGRSGGRNAKTVKRHRMEGTTRKHRHGGYTNADPPLGDPPKTDGLGQVASAEWDRMVERLRLAKTLAVTDDAALLDYVQMHALADRLQATVDELQSLVYFKHTQTMDGDGLVTNHAEPKIHPVVGQLRQARMATKALLVELGQTPASRSRVKVPEQPAEVDPFAEFDGLKAVQ